MDSRHLGPRVSKPRGGRKRLDEAARRAFAVRLADLTKSLGWNAKDLVRRIGRDPRHEPDVETARSWMRAYSAKDGRAPAMPDLPVVLRIAEEADACLDYLLCGVGPMFRSELPKEGESLEAHFRRGTVEQLSGRCGYDPVVADGLLAEAPVLWRIWIGAAADGVEARLEADRAEELRATRGRRLRTESIIASEVAKGVSATTLALEEARKKGLRELVRLAKRRRRRSHTQRRT